jgi:pseudaminic acid cytidylyltransferase
MAIALIPARSGSKRIPNKNIMPVRGRPMMHWPLLAAVNSGVFDRILVSTDDIKYIDIAEQVYGATGFLRPVDLASDTAPLEAVLTDAMQRYPGDEWCMILPTAIDVTPGQIREAYTHLHGPPVVSVTKDRQSADRALGADKDGLLVPVRRDGIKRRTQDCRDTFHDAGAFYWISRRNFLWRWLVFGWDILLQNPVPYIVEGMVDIDTPADLEAAIRA